MLSYDFSHKSVIVTGAARGVGRTLVGAFVGAGARVIAADRDEAGLAETCAPWHAARRAVGVRAGAAARERRPMHRAVLPWRPFRAWRLSSWRRIKSWSIRSARGLSIRSRNRCRPSWPATWRAAYPICRWRDPGRLKR